MSERHDLAVTVAGLEQEFRARDGVVRALDGIDLTIEPGELVTLAGPSGCGKTTLLRILAGFVEPTRGTVEVGGRPVRGPGRERGVVFQQPTLYPWLDVRDNVALGPKVRGVAKAERYRTAERYLELVGLADVAGLRPYELSGGMQQRAQIARVLTNDPEIVLMDEPFGALDALTRERLQEELLTIWRETGKTILFITHGVDEAVFLGSRVLVMSPRPGRIVLDEPARFSTHARQVAPADLRALPEFTALTTKVREAISHP
ncbi:MULTISPECIES: ABC transporter ATP-binding protein [unclassified Aeromicrobium]|uniref:ABC transporter ATP-binding protein n=1 Tax=unclassified Aeromicrobium TaxID=2633570 RepID=UPI000AEB340C|nr:MULTISPECIES: ABC transporter ATP-binding protein [unclassified Aeromicrobium]